MTRRSYPGRLLDFLSARGKSLSPLLILTHDFPDPDALAAAYGLRHLAAKGFGIESRIVYGGVIGRTENRAMVSILRIPAHKLRRADLERHEHVALVDTQPPFENNPFPAERRAALVIDQHASTTRPRADLALIDTDCGATCVIVAQALLAAELPLPARLATALAYGILADTLNLYRAKAHYIVDTYLEVLAHCDMRALARIQNPSRSRDFFQSLSRGIHAAAIYRRLIVSHLRAVRNPDLVSLTADFLLTYENVRWALCTGRYNGRLHLSLRTSQGVAAGRILRDICPSPRDAGGHGTIAGGSLRVGDHAADREWSRVERDVQRRLVRRLRLPAGGRFRKPFAHD